MNGHKALVLTNSYDHADAEHLGDVLAAQGELFDLNRNDAGEGM